MLKQNAPVQTLLPTLPSQTSTSLPASTNLLSSWEVRFATIWWTPHLRQALQPTWRPRVNCVTVQPACCVLGVCVPGLTDLCLCKKFACIKPELYTSILMSATQYMKGTYCPCGPVGTALAETSSIVSIKETWSAICRTKHSHPKSTAKQKVSAALSVQWCCLA